MRIAEILRLLNVFSIGRVFGCLAQKSLLDAKKHGLFCVDLEQVLYPTRTGAARGWVNGGFSVVVF